MPGSETDRPGSSAGRGYQPSPIPPSRRPSVASRASRSSLRREYERHEALMHPRPASVAYSSRPQTPQVVTAAPLNEAPPPSSPSPLQPPAAESPFSPLFALLTSTSHASSRQTIHHPTVHYLFADDDPEILMAALAQHHREPHENNNNNDGEDNDDPNSAQRDRAIIMDIERAATDGAEAQLEVAWASSLSPDWAVTSARLSRVEGAGARDGGVRADGPSGGLVLKIEGVSIEPASGPLGAKTSSPESELHSSGGSAGRQQGAPAAEEYADLLQDFEKRMVVLRKVVEAGAARQRALGSGGQQFQESTRME